MSKPLFLLTATALSLGRRRGGTEEAGSARTGREWKEFLPKPAAGFGGEFTLWGDL
jgi:hypothetical protein